jgi:hypothetical protein
MTREELREMVQIDRQIKRLEDAMARDFLLINPIEADQTGSFLGIEVQDLIIEVESELRRRLQAKIDEYVSKIGLTEDAPNTVASY